MLALVSLFAASAQAFFILTQPVLLTTRLDPIVNPGTISSHVHSIAGGSNFDKSMTNATAQASTCTTASITADKSNYWIPQLYYYNPNTTGFQAIPVSAVNTYYLPRHGKNDVVRAFPDGLRMISGNPSRRGFNANNLEDQAITYVCLGNQGHEDDPEWAQRNSFFNHNCPGGMRAQVNFRNCWDGVNLDSPDHKSHMAWPMNGDSSGNGDCPASHPVKVVELFYEFIFEVQNFPFNAPGTPTWVLANGDTTGYGLHADFLNGWPTLVNGSNVLQRAIDECNQDNGVGGNLGDCPPFAGLINSAQAAGCRPQNQMISEDIGMGHEIPLLPGNNPIWIGDGPKPSRANYTEGNTTYTDFKSTLPTGWKAVGCIAESTSGRALSAYSFTSPNMTLANCASGCAARGYALAGAEYSSECYCDNTMKNGASNTTLLIGDKCNMKCAGNSFETCGGSRTLSLSVNNVVFPDPADNSTTSTTAKPSATSATAVSSASSIASTTSSTSTPSASSTPSNPAVFAGVDGWYKKTQNCVTDVTGKRALTGFYISSGQMTPAACMSACSARGFTFAGTEYSRECYCGSSIDASSREANSTDCNMPCTGQSSEVCGGPSRLNLYYFNATAATGKSNLPKDWTATGCWNSAAGTGKAFSGPLIANDMMTNDVCMLECQNRGYALAGIEYGRECRCAQSFASGSVQAAATDCNFSCAGSPFQVCGAGQRMTTFKYTGTLAAPVVPIQPNNTNVKIAGWTDRGCYSEATTGRALTRYSFSGSDMTIPKCLAACGARGWRYGGVEYGAECFCGDVFASGAAPTSSGCSMVCGGDNMTLCGGSSRLNVFEATVVSAQEIKVATSSKPVSTTAKAATTTVKPSTTTPRSSTTSTRASATSSKSIISTSSVEAAIAADSFVDSEIAPSSKAATSTKAATTTARAAITTARSITTTTRAATTTTRASTTTTATRLSCPSNVPFTVSANGVAGAFVGASTNSVNLFQFTKTSVALPLRLDSSCNVIATASGKTMTASTSSPYQVSFAGTSQTSQRAVCNIVPATQNGRNFQELQCTFGTDATKIFATDGQGYLFSRTSSSNTAVRLEVSYQSATTTQRTSARSVRRRSREA